MKRLLKSFCLILAIVTLASVFTACAAEYGEFSEDTRTVMKIGKFKISYDEYKAFYYGSMAELQNTEYITDFSDEETLKRLKDLTETRLKNRYIIRVLADKYGIKLTKTDKEYIDGVIGSYVDECGGIDEYKQWLADTLMTGKVFRDNVEMIYSYDVSLRELFFTGYENIIPVDYQTIKDDVHENFCHYQIIYLAFEEGDNYLTNLDLINEAYERLSSGADFEALCKEYQRYNATVYATEGYTTEGEKYFYDALEALEIGEYSENPFNYEYDLAIIKRLPLDEKYIDDNVEDLMTVSATRRYNEYIKAESEKLTVKHTSYYDKLTHEKLCEPINLDD